MARKRMISPEIWEDPGFNKLSIGARLLFVGMISNADDDGYLRGDVGSLKRLIFGFDEKVEVKTWKEELNKFKNLHFFKAEDEEFAHFINWDKYQKQREDRRLPSCYPKCVICLTNGGQLPAKVSKLSKEVSSSDKIKILLTDGKKKLASKGII